MKECYCLLILIYMYWLKLCCIQQNSPEYLPSKIGEPAKKHYIQKIKQEIFNDENRVHLLQYYKKVMDDVLEYSFYNLMDDVWIKLKDNGLLIISDGKVDSFLCHLIAKLLSISSAQCFPFLNVIFNDIFDNSNENRLLFIQNVSQLLYISSTTDDNNNNDTNNKQCKLNLNWLAMVVERADMHFVHISKAYKMNENVSEMLITFPGKVIGILKQLISTLINFVNECASVGMYENIKGKCSQNCYSKLVNRALFSHFMQAMDYNSETKYFAETISSLLVHEFHAKLENKMYALNAIHRLIIGFHLKSLRSLFRKCDYNLPGFKWDFRKLRKCKFKSDWKLKTSEPSNYHIFQRIAAVLLVEKVIDMSNRWRKPPKPVDNRRIAMCDELLKYMRKHEQDMQWIAGDNENKKELPSKIAKRAKMPKLQRFLKLNAERINNEETINLSYNIKK